MTPAALGDALLAPGHPPIIEATMLPEGLAPMPPPGLLELRLASAGTLDAPSGFCVKRAYILSLNPSRVDTLSSVMRYRLPTGPAAKEDACGGTFSRFFAVEDSDRPRAFVVIRLLAGTTRAVHDHAPAFPVTVDDQFARDFQAFERAHPDSRPHPTPPAAIIDGRAALAGLPIDDITYVGHRLIDADLLAPALLTRPGGASRERWSLFAGGTWTIDVVLDGDRIAAVALRNAIPPPF